MCSRGRCITRVNQLHRESSGNVILLSVGTPCGLNGLRRGGEEGKELGWCLFCRGNRSLDNNFLLRKWGPVEDLNPAGLDLKCLSRRQYDIQEEPEKYTPWRGLSDGRMCTRSNSLQRPQGYLGEDCSAHPKERQGHHQECILPVGQASPT